MTGVGHRRAGALAAAIALALAGCLTDAPVSTARPSPSPEPEPTPTVRSYPLDLTVWYGGFVITFSSATSRLDAKGGPVTVELAIGNPGPDDATMDAPIVLAAGGETVGPTRESVMPLVTAGGVAMTTMVFDVGPDVDVPAAAIRVGRDEEHQAIVPLVAGPGAVPVTLEPFEGDLAGEGQAGSISVALTGLELRADLPDWNQELPKAVLALTISYRAVFRSDFPGGTAFTTDNVGLTLPSGETIGPRRDGHSHSIALLRPRRTNTIETRFEVPAPGGGQYGFVVRDGTATTVIPFELILP